MDRLDGRFSGDKEPRSSEVAASPALSLLWFSALCTMLVVAIAADASEAQKGIREKVLAGEVIGFDPDRQSPQERTIQAAWIKEAALKHARLSYTNAIIKGALELNHITFEEETSFGNCTFEDRVDFSHTVFKGSLNVAGSTFNKSAFFVDATIEHDATFVKARFLGDVAFFSNSHIQGDFFANGAIFGKGVMAEFIGARFDKYAGFEAVTFGGDTHFQFAQFSSYATFQGARFRHRVEWGLAYFKQVALFGANPSLREPAAVFEGETDFSGARTGFIADFGGVVFEQEAKFENFQAEGGVRFSGAVFKRNCSFNSSHIASHAVFGAAGPSQATRFLAEADFRGVEIGGQADFSKVLFAGNVEFEAAVINRDAIFEGAAFRANANFNHVQFKDGALFGAARERGVRGARFERGADFRGDRFGSNADFEDVEFAGPMKFEQVEIAGRTIFTKAKFLAAGMPSFRGSFFNKEAWFAGTDFPQGVDFRDCEFGSEAGFEGVSFGGMADFSGSRFRGISHFSGGPGPLGTERFRGARFQGVKFDHVVFDSYAQFEDTIFTGPASFRETTFRVVDFSQDGMIRERASSHPIGKGPESEQFQGTVDFRGCSYQRMQVHWRSLFHFGDGTLRLLPYDRQPYTQLEETFRRIGKEDEANAVYLDRRDTERKLKWCRHQFLAWAIDRTYGVVANYGVEPWLLVVVTVLILLFGACVFSRTGALSLKHKDESDVQGTMGKVTWCQAAFVALRYFVPVDILMGSEWTPVDRPIRITNISSKLDSFLAIRPARCAAILRVLGWILVPLAIAWMSGLLRHLGR